MSQSFKSLAPQTTDTKRVLLAKFLIKKGGTALQSDTIRRLRSKIVTVLNVRK